MRFVADQLARWTPSTAATRFRCLQQFFRYAEDTFGHPSPMTGLKPTRVSEAPVPVLKNHELVSLLRTCTGDSFRDARDPAMLRHFIDAGIRRDEVVAMRLADLDLTSRVIPI